MPRKIDPEIQVLNATGIRTYGQRARERIDSTVILKKLALHVQDAELHPLSQTQIAASKLLLDRTVPVIKPIEVKQEGDRNAKTITNSELFLMIEGQSKRVANDS